MAYNGNFNNNAKENKSTNTSGMQFYNSEGIHKSTLRYDYWDKFISIKIHPALPADKMTANEKFDYDQSVMTALNPQKALVLVKHIDEILQGDYVAKGTKFCKGVPIGTNHGIFVGVNVPEEGEAYPYLLIVKDIDPDTKKPGTAIHYQFVGTLAVDYDLATGNSSAEMESTIELEILREALFKDAITLIGATAHASRHIDKWYRDQILAGVGGGKKGGNGGGHSYSSSSVFGGGSSSESKSSAPADRTTLSNFGDIGSMTNM